MDKEKIPDAIDWHEGMLLSPQHFQLMVQRYEALLSRQISTLSPYHYGFTNLLIDRARIHEGFLQVRSLDAIMPDGLIVSIEEGI